VIAARAQRSGPAGSMNQSGPRDGRATAKRSCVVAARSEIAAIPDNFRADAALEWRGMENRRPVPLGMEGGAIGDSMEARGG